MRFTPMKTFSLVTITCALVVIGLVGLTVVPAREIPAADLDGWVTPPAKTMRAFRSEAEMRAYFKALAVRTGRGRLYDSSNGLSAQNATPAPSTPLAKAEASKDDQESVTNVQHAGVDEGGIVKVHGTISSFLRRGRLFTVESVTACSVRSPSPMRSGRTLIRADTWYDEMLISDDTIAVIGYSYERGGTEIGLFNIDERGRLELSIHSPPSFERLLFFPQLCESPG